MNKNNPFDGKAVKFDNAEQLEHLSKLARGYWLQVNNIFDMYPCSYFRDSGIGYYTNCEGANNLPEIHYSDFVKNIEAAKFTETINRTVDNILMSHEIRNNAPNPIARPEQPDMVNHPPHYNVKGFEVIDIIDAFGLNFNMGNALKYLLRADRKGNKVQDLQKAIWYLQREINKK